MIGEMQFTAVMLLSLMALSLWLLLPNRVSQNRVTNLSRWLMIGALAVLVIQFALQHILGLRQTGVVQAAMLNLLLFIPGSALLSLSVLNLQRQGRLTRMEWFVGVPVWLISIALLCWAIITDGLPFKEVSERLKWAEVTASLLYCAMQLYYCRLHLKAIKSMQSALNDYSDRDHRQILDWMRFSVVVLAFMMIIVPLLIFASGWPLLVFALMLFAGIFYLWFCFVCYIVSDAAMYVREAEESSLEDQNNLDSLKDNCGKGDGGRQLSPKAFMQVSNAVDKWVGAGAYLTAGITSPMAAAEMGIPRYQLTMWLKSSGHESFSQWISSLRIAEAKRVLSENPGWTNEAVADHCGFSRSYFQKIFKKATGLSPAEFVEREQQGPRS